MKIKFVGGTFDGFLDLNRLRDLLVRRTERP